MASMCKSRQQESFMMLDLSVNIHFYIFNYDFPVFNIADIAVCLGIGLIILEIIIQEYQIWKLSKSL